MKDRGRDLLRRSLVLEKGCWLTPVTETPVGRDLPRRRRGASRGQPRLLVEQGVSETKRAAIGRPFIWENEPFARPPVNQPKNPPELQRVRDEGPRRTHGVGLGGAERNGANRAMRGRSRAARIGITAARAAHRTVG